MIEYLEQKPLQLPIVLDAPSAPQAGEGSLSTNLKAGVVLLEDAKGQAFRLSWQASEAAAERSRSLPAGAYKLRTYRILGEADGVQWHVSASAPKIQMLEIRAGQETPLELAMGIEIDAKRHGQRAQMSITGHRGAGLSIYRDGVRIPMGYRILDRHGEELITGAMTYG